MEPYLCGLCTPLCLIHFHKNFTLNNIGQNGAVQEIEVGCFLGGGVVCWTYLFI